MHLFYIFSLKKFAKGLMINVPLHSRSGNGYGPMGRIGRIGRIGQNKANRTNWANKANRGMEIMGKKRR